MMERLTERDSCGDVHVKQHDYVTASEKLAEYEDLEEQGLLLRLPVKIGEPCSVIRIAEERTIVNGFLRYVTLCVETEKENMLMHPCNVFANEKEAEQKLKEMEESK